MECLQIRFEAFENIDPLQNGITCNCPGSLNGFINSECLHRDSQMFILRRIIVFFVGALPPPQSKNEAKDVGRIQ